MKSLTLNVPQSGLHLNLIALRGSDAFHFDQPTGNLYLYKFKRSDDATLFKDCYRRMIDAIVSRG